MKYTITTYDTNGNVIIPRNYWAPSMELVNLLSGRELFADQIESILEDSQTYLEEQALDYKEESQCPSAWIQDNNN